MSVNKDYAKTKKNKRPQATQFKPKNINVEVDGKLHAQFKTCACKLGFTLKESVTQSLKDFVKAHS